MNGRGRLAQHRGRSRSRGTKDIGLVIFTTTAIAALAVLAASGLAGFASGRGIAVGSGLALGTPLATTVPRDDAVVNGTTELTA